jgi:hypothetical protein
VDYSGIGVSIRNFGKCCLEKGLMKIFIRHSILHNYRPRE